MKRALCLLAALTGLVSLQGLAGCNALAPTRSAVCIRTESDEKLAASVGDDVALPLSDKRELAGFVEGGHPGDFFTVRAHAPASTTTTHQALGRVDGKAAKEPTVVTLRRVVSAVAHPKAVLLLASDAANAKRCAGLEVKLGARPLGKLTAGGGLQAVVPRDWLVDDDASLGLEPALASVERREHEGVLFVKAAPVCLACCSEQGSAPAGDATRTETIVIDLSKVDAQAKMASVARCKLNNNCDYVAQCYIEKRCTFKKTIRSAPPALRPCRKGC